MNEILCPHCQRAAKILTAKSGAHAGEQFAKCVSCDKWLQWVDQATAPRATSFTKFKQGDADRPPYRVKPKLEPIPFNPNFKPSPFQSDIRDFVLNDTRNLREEAVAGSGKTTSNVWVALSLPRSITTEMMVFSKSNAVDMQRRVPEYVKASTAHSGGYSDIKARYPKTKMMEQDGRDAKMWGFLNDKYPGDNPIQENASEILKLVSLCKNTLTAPEPDALESLCEHYDVSDLNGARSEIFDAVKVLFEASRDTIATMINFDDMVYAPAAGIVPTHTCDLLFVDEAQDTNKAQQEYYLKV